MQCTEMDSCLCCGSKNLFTTLDLGCQPPANSYKSTILDIEKEYPLKLNTCLNCWHSQLSHCLDRKKIFDHYLYSSGTSGTLSNFFKWFSTNLKSAYPNGCNVLDIAANDGSLVQELNNSGCNAIGIDPAKNIVTKAKENGRKVLCGYWPSDSYKIETQQDVIICMNVLAHVDNPKSFLKGCAEKLRKGGAILVQPSQARMFGNNEFDTCYHEHLSFFNTRSISTLANSVDLDLYDSILVNIHGDSPIYLIGHKSYPPDINVLNFFKNGDFYIDDNLTNYEESIDLFNLDTYKRFQSTALQTIKNLSTAVTNYRNDGYKIVFVGAAAKAMTVINAANVKPDLFLDESQLKIGLFAPGLNVVISNLNAIQNLKQKSFFVITAWNFKNELIEKISKIGLPGGSIFYTYFPKEELVKF